MSRILMIQPKGHETFWQLKGINDITRRRAVMPPVGLALLAACTSADHEITIVDEYVEEIDFDFPCDMAAITGFTMHSFRMKEVAREFQKRGVLTVGGGPYVSGHNDEAKEIFDVVISGEAEETWPEFLRDYAGGRHKAFYANTALPDLKSCPLPRWDLVKMQHYTSSVVQTSRGCPHDCEFCDVIVFYGRKTRTKPIENVIREIEHLSAMGRPEIFLADDNFIGNRRYVKSLLQEIIRFNQRAPKPLRFCTQVTLNVAKDDDLLDLLVKANFYMLFIGIETPSMESLQSTGKDQNLHFDMSEAIRKIQARGIFVSSGMIVGFDTDGHDIFERQFQFMTDNAVTLPLVSMLTAMKGTSLWKRLEKEGRLIPELETGDMALITNFYPRLMSREELQAGYARLSRRLYTPEAYYLRLAGLVDQLDLKRIKKDSPLKTVMSFKNWRMFYLGTIYRLLKFYLFHSNRQMRELFRKSVLKGFQKSLLSVPLLVELLLVFKAQSEFVTEHFSETLDGKTKMAQQGNVVQTTPLPHFENRLTARS